MTDQKSANGNRRGFASMDASKQREIASRGGKAAHAQGRAHEFTADEARAAGRKGGEAVSRDRAHMAEIGRRGGMSRGRRFSQMRQEAQAQAQANAGQAQMDTARGSVEVRAEA